jgi:SAM-dependent methyltransferase
MGHDDPYFGVLSDESFRIENLTEDSRVEFFQSGQAHIDALLATIRERFKADFTPDLALDFGCGVGRLLIPLAKCSRRAVGVDVSPSMLAEARRNCERMLVENVDLLRSDDKLSEARHTYDLIHSHIVFAHIDPRRGHTIFEALAEKVAAGGFIAIQVLYACNAPRLTRAVVKLRYRLPLLNAMRNMLRGRPLGEPPMQLHIYDLATLLHALNHRGFGEALLLTDRFDNDMFDSVVVIARRIDIERTP